MTWKKGTDMNFGIKSLRIEELFGRYSYTLPIPGGNLSNLAILYGDNGSGKTTILNLIFHILSPASNRGHRNAIARIPFIRIDIELNDGQVFSAHRPSLEHRAYNLEISGPNCTNVELLFDPSLSDKFHPADAQNTYLQQLRDLNLSVFKLSAEREILSDSWDDPRSEQEMLERRLMHESRGLPIYEQLLKQSLDRAVWSANNWIRGRAVQGTNVGSENTNEIYDRIVKRIAGTQFGSVGENTKNVAELRTTLNELAVRNADFSRFLFTSPLKIDSMVEVLEGADAQATALIVNILEPYIEGIEARLNALNEVQIVADTLVKNFNEFYTDKFVQFDLSNGLRIESDRGDPLDPTDLSSGEQQLLRLFCHTVVSRDRPSVFIIDEPELSLNVKWQRKLVGALLDLVQDSEMQFVFATHSMELLAQYRNNVQKLDNNLQLEAR